MLEAPGAVSISMPIEFCNVALDCRSKCELTLAGPPPRLDVPGQVIRTAAPRILLSALANGERLRKPRTHKAATAVTPWITHMGALSH